MNTENKTLNDYCVEFQQNVIDLFNNEQNLPFILKYYLIKDVWDNIQSTKTKMDIETRSKMQTTVTKTVDLETGEATEEEIKETEEM